MVEKNTRLVDIISPRVYNLWIMILLLIGTFILQNGDTLFFLEGNEPRESLIVAATVIDSTKELRLARRVKVSDSGDKYCVYEEKFRLGPDSLVSTKISFYDSHSKEVFKEEVSDDRQISFELSNAYDSMLVLTTWDHSYKMPALCTIKDDKRQEIIKEGDWDRIVSYQVSSNNRYMLFHMRSPYHDKPWDYIYFYDLLTGQDWDYLFPSCLSCKKSRIYLTVNDNGRAEVVYKNEHRVFSAQGVMENIYLKSR
jgi:hypothetical protein